MKGGEPVEALPAGEIEWRTGTHLDLYTPLYRKLLTLGIKEHEARLMDISNVALTLGMPGPGVAGPSLAEVMDEAPPLTTPEGEHMPATAPPNIPAPPWWRGNKAAFRSSVAAAGQMGLGFTRSDD